MMLLKNAHVVDYISDTDSKLDILIKNGRIAAVSDKIMALGAEEIDCRGLVAFPGIFDMHVHARDPGQTDKEDLLSCAKAAAAGGVTGFVCMPNTVPVIDNEKTLKYINTKAKAAKVKVYPACAITEGQMGAVICDFKLLKDSGAVAATDDGKPVKSARIMGEAMIKASDEQLPLISHCEDMDIASGGLINAGLVSIELDIYGSHRSSENIITGREIDLARDLHVPVHIAHVSTAESVAKIRAAKQAGIQVTCETAPHYFALTEDLLYAKDADYRMNPPLRLGRDVDAIIEGIADGTIDCIATDHAPHTPAEKADFHTAPNGVIGLETSLAACLTFLYHTEKVSLKDLVRLMCVNPRKILGMKGGSFKPGELADITLFEPNTEWEVTPKKFKSKARNSCFKGMKLKGRVRYTIVDGDIVYEI